MHTGPMHKVTFRGANRTVEAEHGENLLTLAKRHGLQFDSSCGGNGSCHQCRVLIHEGQATREGKPAVARHRLGDRPVYLACQCEVRSNLVVEPAPVHRIATDHPDATLIGWNVGTDEQVIGPALAVIDPGVKTGGMYTVSITGDIEREHAFAPYEYPPAGDLQPVHVTHTADELAWGTIHLGDGTRLILDVAAGIAVCEATQGKLRPEPTAALLGDVPHLPGAVDYVEWSPLKTRTILTTLAGLTPTGLCASGFMSCVAALFAAGMCDQDGRLKESRFARMIEDERTLVLVGPKDEAQTPHGQLMTAPVAVTLKQWQLTGITGIGRMLHARLHELAPAGYAGPLVITGEFGTHVHGAFIRALGIWDGPLEFVPHAAALGAARRAFRQP
jgi:ferredoxin